MPMLVRLVKQGDSLVPDRLLRASDFANNLGETNNPEWKTVGYDETSEAIVVPRGSVGFRWGEKGKWNLEEKETEGRETNLQLSFAANKDEFADVAFPYFGNREHDHFAGTDHPSVLVRKVPAKRVQLKDGEALVASVFDLFVANYGLDRGFGGKHVAKSYNEMTPYTPAWAEQITGVPRDQIVQVAREFARNAEKTKGRSMIIIGAAMNHWFHCDMNYAASSTCW
jgi:nitrate reductase alpha subunit